MKSGTIAVIQARMGSERLPGKVMADIAGQTMLERVVKRVQGSRSIERVVIATTTNEADDRIALAADSLGADVVRGSEEDVLDRFHDAALRFEPSAIMRVSADSPFVDPQVCDKVADAFHSARVDYASNKLSPSYPLGLDVEVFSRDALDRAWSSASEQYERAHVTVYMYENPSLFSLLPVVSEKDLHDWRWTVDTAEDLAFARAVFERLDGRNDFSWTRVIEIIESEPGLAEINSHVSRRSVEEG